MGHEKKLRIGMDIDGVLLDFVTPLIDFYNKTYHTHYRLSDITDFDLWKIWGGTRDRAIDIVAAFADTPHFENLQPLDGAVDAVFLLTKKYTCCVITSRPKAFEQKTKQHICTYFGNSFSNIFTTNNTSKEGGEKKSDICKRENIALMVDDALENVFDCATNGIPVVMLDQYWNQTKHLPKLVTRVYSWQEGLSAIDELAKKYHLL